MQEPTFGEAVAAWFRSVNWEGDRRKMSLNEVFERSGVARNTLYRMEAGLGAEQETLDAVADALGVPRPRVLQTLTMERGKAQGPETALDWLGEARMAIDRAARLLRASESPAAKAAELAESSRALDRAKGQHRPPRKARKAGGQG